MGNKKKKNRHSIDKENSLAASAMQEIFPEISETVNPMRLAQEQKEAEEILKSEQKEKGQAADAKQAPTEPQTEDIPEIEFSDADLSAFEVETEEVEAEIEDEKAEAEAEIEDKKAEAEAEIEDKKAEAETEIEDEESETETEIKDKETEAETEIEDEEAEVEAELEDEELEFEEEIEAEEAEYEDESFEYDEVYETEYDEPYYEYEGEIPPVVVVDEFGNPISPDYYDPYTAPEMKKKKFRWGHFIIWTLAIALAGYGVWNVLYLVPKEKIDVDSLLEETIDLHAETETPEPETTKENPVPKPEIDEQLLPKNPYSRPGKKVKAIEKIVIHYLANPQTTAQQNRDYFASLKELKNESMSANYIVGLDGEIIECVPPGEIAYASNEMNEHSVSIENCHLDDSGRFKEATYESDVHLTAWLLCEYNLGRDDIIRHYDVTEKLCPRFYVEHADKWEQFKDDVMTYIEECKAEKQKNDKKK